METEKTEQKNGPLIGVIIILLLCAFGAYYLWMKEQSKQQLPETHLSLSR